MKTTIFLSFLLSLVYCTSLFSQSNINQTLSVNSSGAAAHASTQLDVSATDKGMLVPRMNSAQRTAIFAPASGLLVFDTDTDGFWFYNGVAWTNLSAPRTLQDTDGNTKVQVEKNANEDIIRFDLAGTESMVLLKSAGSTPRLELPNALNNTFLGQSAGAANTSGGGNTANGRQALSLNTLGENNTAIGFNALFSNTTGSRNTANGTSALSSNNGFENTATGYRALFQNSLGNHNTANGAWALNTNMTGNDNTATGREALYTNSSGDGNTANGFNALFKNTSGNRNTAIGWFALYNNTTGSQNIAIGREALYTNTTGTENTAIGTRALYSNTSSFNTAVGSDALSDNTTGIENTATGYDALDNNTTGNQNTANGYRALLLNSTGSDNTANGRHALYLNTTGSGNTATGKEALNNNTTGNNNTALGTQADVSSGTLTNATVIGNTASVNASNKVRIGNASVTVIEGQVAYTFPSDARFKFNIHDENVPGLAFINQLRPVTYQFDTRKFDEHVMQNMPDSVQQRRMAGQDYSKSTALVQTGFLAQEVEQVCKDLNFQFSGLHVPESEVDNYGLAYGSFVPLLVKGMQEQQAIIEELKAENASLKARDEQQQAQLDKITAALQGAGVAVEK